MKQNINTPTRSESAPSGERTNDDANHTDDLKAEEWYYRSDRKQYMLALCCVIGGSIVLLALLYRLAVVLLS